MKRSTRGGKGMMVFGLLLLAAALLLAVYSLWGEYQATKNSEHALAQVELLMEMGSDKTGQQDPSKGQNQDTETGVDPESDSEAGDGMTVRMVDSVDYIGIVEIPSLALKLPVIREWDDAKLKIAPCRYVGSAYERNMIISGHSYKNHFRYIRNLRAGDTVLFTDFDGTCFTYEVASYEVVNGDDVEGMLAGDWDLSLFTCTYNGSARHTVRCRLVPEKNPWMEE